MAVEPIRANIGQQGGTGRANPGVPARAPGGGGSPSLSQVFSQRPRSRDLASEGPGLAQFGQGIGQGLRAFGENIADPIQRRKEQERAHEMNLDLLQEQGKMSSIQQAFESQREIFAHQYQRNQAEAQRQEAIYRQQSNAFNQMIAEGQISPDDPKYTVLRDSIFAQERQIDRLRDNDQFTHDMMSVTYAQMQQAGVPTDEIDALGFKPQMSDLSRPAKPVPLNERPIGPGGRPVANREMIKGASLILTEAEFSNQIALISRNNTRQALDFQQRINQKQINYQRTVNMVETMEARIPDGTVMTNSIFAEMSKQADLNDAIRFGLKAASPEFASILDDAIEAHNKYVQGDFEGPRAFSPSDIVAYRGLKKITDDIDLILGGNDRKSSGGKTAKGLNLEEPTSESDSVIGTLLTSGISPGAFEAREGRIKLRGEAAHQHQQNLKAVNAQLKEIMFQIGHSDSMMAYREQESFLQDGVWNAFQAQVEAYEEQFGRKPSPDLLNQWEQDLQLSRPAVQEWAAHARDEVEMITFDMTPEPRPPASTSTGFDEPETAMPSTPSRNPPLIGDLDFRTEESRRGGG